MLINHSGRSFLSYAFVMLTYSEGQHIKDPK